jgi:hypothetical protein
MIDSGDSADLIERLGQIRAAGILAGVDLLTSDMIVAKLTKGYSPE